MVDRRHVLELRVPPVAQSVIYAFAMWAVGRALPAVDLPWTYRLGIGLTLAATGFAIALTGVITFHRALTTINPIRPDSTSTLVTTGVYRYSRNPMYLGILMALMGWCVVLGSLWSLFVLPLFVVTMTRLQIIPEEKAMAALFGAEYVEYRNRVRRWI